jgi:hypothetical protein
VAVVRLEQDAAGVRAVALRNGTHETFAVDRRGSGVRFAPLKSMRARDIPVSLPRLCGQSAVGDGRPLKFFNVGMSGGFIAQYADTGKEYGSHECFVSGIRCHADEARFGGIVIEPVE